MPDQALAARLASAGAGMLSLSILADSGVEHYRGAFANPAMAVPIVTSALSLAISTAPPLPMVSGVVQATALASGTAGLGFHLFNIGKRVGGFGFTNLFYAAPIGAPAALILSGVLRNAADALAGGGPSGPFDWRSGRALGAVAALGIAGTVGEAALLHFRGAFQHPAMWLPVALLGLYLLIMVALTRLRAETALRDANERLELRVTERTAELHEALARLHQEVQEREKMEEALRHAQKMEPSAS